MTSDDTPPKEGDLPQSSTPQLVTLDGPTPEVVVPAEKAKKPRKPRPPKIVAKLATIGENSTPRPSADPSKEPQLPLEFWTGLMETQKVIMARRNSDHYNSFRIV